VFLHFNNGARGRVDDPRQRVEANGYLGLEFAVRHQIDVMLQLPSTNQYTTTNNNKTKHHPQCLPSYLQNHHQTKYHPQHLMCHLQWRHQTIVPINSTVLIYNSTNKNHLVCDCNKVRRNPSSYLRESTDPDKMSLLRDDHYKAHLNPKPTPPTAYA